MANRSLSLRFFMKLGSGACSGFPQTTNAYDRWKRFFIFLLLCLPSNKDVSVYIFCCCLVYILRTSESIFCFVWGTEYVFLPQSPLPFAASPASPGYRLVQSWCFVCSFSTGPSGAAGADTAQGPPRGRAADGRHGAGQAGQGELPGRGGEGEGERDAQATGVRRKPRKQVATKLRFGT